jgi:hypothetical protein
MDSTFMCALNQKAAQWHHDKSRITAPGAGESLVEMKDEVKGT